MKKKVFSNFIKKSVAFVLALAMVVTGLYFAKPEASEAVASNTGVAAAEVLDMWGTSPMPEVGYIFAGWYEDAELTKPLKEKPESYAEGTVYYPKWVDEGLLTVKMQMQKNASGTYNLRLISSVDTLNYNNIGFNVYFKDQKIPWSSQTVVTRVNAKNITEKYEFSPAVINADAEYFFTATLVDVAAKNFAEDFRIEPFWTTFDGAVIHGQNRCFSIEDGFVESATSKAVTNINIPVKMNEPEEGASFTATGVTYKAGVAENVTFGNVEFLKYDGEYAHFNITTTANKANMLGATKITVTETGAANSGTEVYRNLEATTMNDSSWYYVAATITDTTAKKFVINTAGEFYGLQALPSEDNLYFANKAVVLSKNVALNTVTEGTSATWKTGTVPANKWVPIAQFRGTLDGNGNTLRGLYIAGSGIFTRLSGFVKDLVIEDSCVKNTADITGVIAGTIAELYAPGTGITYYAGIDTVKVGVRVYVTSTNGYVGGFAGAATNCIFSNSEFAGNVEAGGTNGAGFAGQVLNATDVEFKNCLNTGVIKATNYTGGFVGSVRHNSVGTKSNVTLRNCLNAGTIDVSNTPDRASAIVANLNTTNNTAVLEDVYSTTAVYGAYTSNATVAIGRRGDSAQYYGHSGHLVENANGDNAFTNINFDYWSEDNADGAWVASANSYPQLKTLTTLTEDEIQQTHSTGAHMQATDWYYSKVQVNGTVNSDANNANKAITYELETASDVRGFAWLVDNTKDDFAGDTVNLSKSIIMNTVWDGREDSIATSSVMNWAGLGTGTLVFKGIFDGQNHTLSRLYQNRAGNQGGLFRTLAGTVQNLVISDSFFSVKSNGGSVAGTMTSGKLENVCVEKTVKVSVQTDANYAHHGGLVGLINGAGGVIISNCSFAGDLIGGGTPYGHGGILGTADASCTINSCTFTGTVTSPRSVGGIVGKVRNNSPRVVVTDCVVGGTLTITSDSGRIGSVTGATYSGSTLQYSNIDDSACTLIRMSSKINTKKYGNADGTVTNLDAQ